jgi:hypothetical protein
LIQTKRVNSSAAIVLEWVSVRSELVASGSLGTAARDW